MLRTRFWMLVAVLGLTLGTLLATAGYGLYLRSSMYCHFVARRASRFLNAPVQIGGTIPMDHASQGFRDVAVWLPGEFNPIFTCRMAVVRLTDSTSTELELRDGRIEARTDYWDSATLAKLLAMSFGHDFQQIRLRAVRIRNMDVVARRGRARLWASGVGGHVDLSGRSGRMDLICEGFNGVPAAEPIRLRCDFEPGAKPLIRELSLSVPRSEIAGLLANGTRPQSQLTASQTQPAAGWVAGNIVYRQKSPESLAGPIEFSGSLADADLAVIGSAMGKSGLDGLVNCTVDRAILDDGQVQSVQGRLRIDRLDLAGLFALAGLPPAAGSAALNLNEILYEAGSVRALLADAEVRDLQVEPLLELLEVGTVTGQLSAQVRKVKIAGGRLEELEGAARMIPPTGETGSIDRSILAAAVQRFWKMSLPPILPEKVPYADLGVRFHSEGGELHVEGVAGPDQQFVLVAQVDSAPMPLVPAPPGTIQLGRLQARVESELRRLCGQAAGWVSAAELPP